MVVVVRAVLPLVFVPVALALTVVVVVLVSVLVLVLVRLARRVPMPVRMCVLVNVLVLVVAPHGVSSIDQAILDAPAHARNARRGESGTSGEPAGVGPVAPRPWTSLGL